jgi:type VI secretion system protein ImpG
MRRPGRQDITQQVSAYVMQAAQSGDVLDQKRLESIRSIYIQGGHARATRRSPMAWVRSVRVDIDIDTSHHADQGAWLFARVIAQALSQSMSLNDGMEVQLYLDGELASTHLNTERVDGVLE